jgi:cation-transporting ATPase G
LAAVVFVHELAEVVVIANGVRAGRAKALEATDHTGQSAPARAETVGVS